jgi:two-component system phosphate regulon response regulator PhoB
MSGVPTPPSRLTVLVIDDGPDNRVLLRALLDRGGYRPVLADSGTAGLACLEQETPALILLDYMMPDMTGPEVARLIRSRPGGGDIPIVVLTASADEGHVEEAFRAGADDYLIKPFDRKVLMARVAETIARCGRGRS